MQQKILSWVLQFSRSAIGHCALSLSPDLDFCQSLGGEGGGGLMVLRWPAPATQVLGSMDRLLAWVACFKSDLGANRLKHTIASLLSLSLTLLESGWGISASDSPSSRA